MGVDGRGGMEKFRQARVLERKMRSLKVISRGCVQYGKGF